MQAILAHMAFAGEKLLEREIEMKVVLSVRHTVECVIGVLCAQMLHVSL